MLWYGSIIPPEGIIGSHPVPTVWYTNLPYKLKHKHHWIISSKWLSSLIFVFFTYKFTLMNLSPTYP